MNAAPLYRLLAVRLATHDPERLAAFYAEAIGAVIDEAVPIVGDGGRLRLAVGAQVIELDRVAGAGACYPDDIAADDPRFQHVALVVADIAACHARAIAAGARAISRGGPVTLPVASGGVTAVKLRDPEGHPFEFLQFPAGSQPRWDAIPANRRGIRGIDHSAIVVSDAPASARFYAAHGLAVTAATLNRGAEQAALDGLADPIADVVPLMPPVARPHLELLGYRRPVRVVPPRVVPPRVVPPVGRLDVAATYSVWASDRDGILIDPDGHRHRLVADQAALRRDIAASR